MYYFLEKRTCAVCGKKFDAKSVNNILCSEECKKERARLKAKKKQIQKQKDLPLTEICKAAKEAGMSYGKYVAMLNERLKNT